MNLNIAAWIGDTHGSEVRGSVWVARTPQGVGSIPAYVHHVAFGVLGIAIGIKARGGLGEYKEYLKSGIFGFRNFYRPRADFPHASGYSTPVQALNGWWI